MVCDKPISKQIPEPLPNTAHYMVSCGPPRSGKTSALISLLTQTGPAIYRKAFNNIMVIMPPASRASLKSDPFDTIDERKVFGELTPEVLDEVEAFAKGMMEENKTSLLYVDDMAASLKNNDLLKKWNTLINNRRHLRLSIWCIVQTYKSIPLSNRRTITHMMLFKPNNRREGEAITEELVMMPPAEWDVYVRHAFGGGTPHSFLFLDVDAQSVYDRDFNRLQCGGGHSIEADDPSDADSDSDDDGRAVA